MTGNTKRRLNSSNNVDSQYRDIPERSAGHFSSAKDPGIVVDVEIQAGDPVDSQFIRNFMGEFEAASKARSV